jgi:hypothetical protein
MTLQTVELQGERYVILREKEFLELEQSAHATTPAEPAHSSGGPFREVIPLRLGGVPASELLIQDRR